MRRLLLLPVLGLMFLFSGCIMIPIMMGLIGDDEGVRVCVYNESGNYLLCVINLNYPDSLFPGFIESETVKLISPRHRLDDEGNEKNVGFAINPWRYGASSYIDTDSHDSPFTEIEAMYILVYDWNEVKHLSDDEIRNGNFELARYKLTEEIADSMSNEVRLYFPADFNLLREVEGELR